MNALSLVQKDVTKWGQEKTLVLQIKAYRCHFSHFKPFTLLYKTHAVIQSYLSVATFSWSHSFTIIEISIPLIYHQSILSLPIHLSLKILISPQNTPASAWRQRQQQGICRRSWAVPAHPGAVFSKPDTYAVSHRGQRWQCITVWSCITSSE